MEWKFELPDGSYYVSNIQYYFEHVIKKHKTVTDSLSVSIYVNETEGNIICTTKIEYYLHLLTAERMKLL